MALWQKVKGVAIASTGLQPTQCRMARAALGWTLDDLAAASEVNRKTILRFERKEAVARPATLQALRSAFEAAGIRFGEEGAVFPPA